MRLSEWRRTAEVSGLCQERVSAKVAVTDSDSALGGGTAAILSLEARRQTGRQADRQHSLARDEL